MRADPSAALRVLLAVSRYPWPPRRGDQLRTLQAVDALASRHRVTLLLPAPPPGAPAPPEEFPAAIETYRAPWRSAGWSSLAGVATALGSLWGAARGRNPLQSVLFASPDLGRALRRLAPSADVAVLQLVRLAPFAAALPGTPTVIDLIDSLALSTGRRARFDRPWLAPWLGLESLLLARSESRLVTHSASALVVSERDRAAVAARLAPEPAGRLRVVPVAVEGVTGPIRKAGAPEGDAPPVLALTGNLGYFPTREGARWWLRRVWPRLRAALPAARLVLAGSRVPRSLGRLARRAGAEVLADPPDLTAVLAGARIALAPMRAGAGQPLKVMEAWAAGVPVVATRWAAAGTSGRAVDGAGEGEPAGGRDRQGGQEAEDLVVADGAEEWVERIGALWDDRERRRRIAASARRRLARDYAPAAVRTAWLEAVEAAASSISRRARSASPASRK